ncbi:uncharacterized protein LOC111715477 [Eurytemora carolleeae]|uniref:uncharacterized protein LOC111715477 n=1 Tax=Eurytemora carolleeae TaxID=1294199 RepID=UPI000C77F566|nr:uncharacterized protein LOC111715477 [Eurytemora carolleeae]|eukprot:XP_023346574.1 uncharacterized protein LOC111715477 [Eurytemora affinis]
MVKETNKNPKKEQLNLLESFRRFQHQVFSTTSAHGFHWIIDAPALGEKIFWFILSISFFTVGIVLSVISIKGEIDNPKYTTALEIEEGDTVNGIPFPDFAICDPNPFSLEKAQEANVSETLLAYLTNYVYVGVDTIENMTCRSDKLDAEFIDTLARFNNDTIKLLDAVTKTCEDILIYCQAGFNPYHTSDCCSKYFNQGEYTMDFKCYSTRGKMNYTILYGNRMSGITIIVDSERNKILFPQDLASWKTKKYSGIGVAVIPKKSSIFSAVQKGVKLLSPDSNNDVMITKSVMDRTAEKHGIFMRNKNGCVDEENEEFYMNLVSPYSEHYSADQCFLYNKQLSYNSDLNCTIPILPPPGIAKKNCTPLEYIKYYDPKYRDQGRKTMTTTKCLTDCIVENFGLEISSSDITKEMIDMVETHTKMPNLTLVMFTIFVKGMDHSVLKFNGQSLNDLLSTVGGNLGLWFGGSIITFIEVLICSLFFFYLMIGKVFGCQIYEGYPDGDR